MTVSRLFGRLSEAVGKGYGNLEIVLTCSELPGCYLTLEDVEPEIITIEDLEEYERED